MLMAGVFVGVNIPKVVPSYMTIILLMIVLLVSTYKFVFNLMKQRRREEELGNRLLADTKGETSNGDLSVHKVLVKTEREEYDPQAEEKEEEEMKEFLKEEQRLIPFEKYREVFIMIFAIVVLVLLRGSKATPSLIEIPYCGLKYWIFLLVILLFFVLMFWRTSRLVQSWQNKRVEMGLKYSNELHLSKDRILTIGGLAGCAGIIGASISIGGGMIMQPFFLHWGLPPRDTSYTCAFFIIFTLFNTTYQQLLAGALNLHQIAWFGGIAFVCSFLSSKIVGAYIRKTGKQSVLLQLLVIVSAISIVMEVYVTIDEVKHDYAKLIAWKDICA